MTASSADIAGLRTIVVSEKTPLPLPLTIVMLHGYAMVPEALAPFTRSLGVPARYLLPEGPRIAQPEGRAWWDIDHEAKARARAAGPRDLADKHPAGEPAARAQLVSFLEAVRREWSDGPLAIVGFSQGGMLALSTVLHDQPRVDALALLSASRLAIDEWAPLAHRLKNLPVLVSHGKQDDDLAFAAGEALRDFVADAGAGVTWVPFDQGHEIPLIVWRALRKFLGRAAPSGP